MADSDRVVLKISYEDQLRRTQLTKNPLSIEEVHEQISRLFPDVKNYLLYYIDDEGDKITVTTDVELQEAHWVLSSTLRLTLERQSTSDYVPPTGSLVRVAPSLEQKVDLTDLQKKLLILKQKAEELERIQQIEIEKREKEERERVTRELREKEERERLEQEQREKEERERREKEERDRHEKEERERLEKVERERREKEEKELQRLLREKVEREQELLRQHREKQEQERNSKEKSRDKILKSNPQCAEILEKLFSENVELELAWQALEYANYSNEKRVRDLLQMNKLGFDIKVASEALTKFKGDVEAAVDYLMG